MLARHRVLPLRPAADLEAAQLHRPPILRERGGMTVLRERELVSPTGASWRVREALMPDGEFALVFDTRGTARRVRHFPRDWWRLPDEALWQVSWSR
jgi:hypothetical protein